METWEIIAKSAYDELAQHTDSHHRVLWEHLSPDDKDHWVEAIKEAVSTYYCEFALGS